MEKNFYILRDTTISSDKLIKHLDSINILISQAYHVDQAGTVTGSVDSNLLKFSAQHSIKLMPMLTNSNFETQSVHTFLSHSKAQQRTLEFLLEACQKNHFYGIQFDLEMVTLTDKNALTHFYQMASEILHKNGFIVSFAVAPIISDGPFSSVYQERMYRNWAGAYDLKSLSKSADFITLMTYDQHIGRITPGPIASFPWVEAVIKHALKFIPSQKISLGIPTYSGFWYTGTNPVDKKIMLQNDTISYEVAIQILQKNNVRLQWNNLAKINHAMFERHWLNEYLFLEDEKSFKAKLALVNQYNLRGISVFRIGVEDPKIWDVLNKIS